jgi:DNA-binding NarL/FixJ family response regulator
VLLADDHPAVLERIERLLAQEYDIVGAVGDGREALAAATQLEPDVLVLDISMPELNGIEVAHRLKVAGSAVKIVFLTVHEDKDFARAALSAGGQGYVIKPHLATELPAAVREVLAGRSFVSHIVE